ncbi:MAG: cobalt ECF transporter T component CbiQ [Eubacteriales bacterium]
MLSIDKICYNSNLRYSNTEQKILYAVTTLFLCVASQLSIVALVVLSINTYLIIEKSGMSFARFLYYLKIPLVFLILSTLAMITNFAHTPMDAFAIPMHNMYITCSVEVLRFAGRLILTALASVTCLYFVSFTTPMTEILKVMQQWKVPSLFVELMMLMYRYIFILLEVAANIGIAQRARLGNKDYKTSVRSFAQLVSILFIRAIKKSNQQFDAIESRGYNGKLGVLNESNPPNHRVTMLIVMFEIVLIGLGIIVKMGVF